MSADLSRTDVLRPLMWLTGTLVLASVGAFLSDAPKWATIAMLSMLGTSVLAYISAYAFCLFSDRDALRSEKYSLQKMAIEQGLYGDSDRGLIEPNDNGLVALPSTEKTKPEGEK